MSQEKLDFWRRHLRKAAGTVVTSLIAGTAPLIAASDPPLSGGAFTHSHFGPEAFLQPGPLADDRQRKTFADGIDALKQRWVPPFLSGGPWGRGPLSNAEACTDCHANNGRGRAPEGAGGPLRSMLVRLSVPGDDGHGGPKAHPAYGSQFNHVGVDDQVAPEGEIRVTWQDKTVQFADGESLTLRTPKIQFEQLSHGPLGPDTMVSVRIAPQLVGLGLLDAIPEATIVALAQREKPHGIGGKPNRVWDLMGKRMVVGRLGLKANQPSIAQQVMAAFHGDLGVTSELFPEESCTPVQRACAAMMPGGRPELLSNQFNPLVFFLRANAVPGAGTPTTPRLVAARKFLLPPRAAFAMCRN
jgi:CxxC motif-containing protein (DUF1111 family)